MSMRVMKLSKVWVLLTANLIFAGYGQAAAVENTLTATDSIHFHVSYKSNIEPLPLNLIHSWVLHVDTLDGKPVLKASISVYGGMPKHKHGLPTQPEVTELGDGNYLVEGLKFSMVGVWKIWFKIKEDEITDAVSFDVEL